jgi:hypothetical protein
MSDVSFLLGAGFSKPAGYPLAQELNDTFRTLCADEITIHSDGTAWFNEGSPHPNDQFMRRKERKFIEQLTEYYVSEVLGSSDYHYEEFYDWYKRLLREEESDATVEAIAEDLNRGAVNLLLQFDQTFNQLLANEITKWHPEVHKIDGPEPYQRFLEVTSRLASQGHTLHFHTLNHDLFFETLSSTDVMGGGLDDGFTEFGSPFYGKIRQRLPDSNEGGKGWVSYTVRLPHFTGNFGSQFNLYKVHGSVDFYIYSRDERLSTVRCPRGVDHGDLLKEVHSDEGLQYRSDPGNYHPSFLSGTTYKKMKYDATPYYERVFECFERNLLRSNLLVVIGYGFCDEAINDLLKEHFTSRAGTKLVVVDKSEPKVPDYIGEYVGFTGGVEQLPAEEISNTQV